MGCRVQGKQGGEEEEGSACSSSAREQGSTLVIPRDQELGQPPNPETRNPKSHVPNSES